MGLQWSLATCRVRGVCRDQKCPRVVRNARCYLGPPEGVASVQTSGSVDDMVTPFAAQRASCCAPSCVSPQQPALAWRFGWTRHAPGVSNTASARFLASGAPLPPSATPDPHFWGRWVGNNLQENGHQLTDTGVPAAARWPQRAGTIGRLFGRLRGVRRAPLRPCCCAFAARGAPTVSARGGQWPPRTPTLRGPPRAVRSSSSRSASLGLT